MSNIKLVDTFAKFNPDTDFIKFKSSKLDIEKGGFFEKMMILFFKKFCPNLYSNYQKTRVITQLAATFSKEKDQFSQLNADGLIALRGKLIKFQTRLLKNVTTDEQFNILKESFATIVNCLTTKEVLQENAKNLPGVYSYLGMNTSYDDLKPAPQQPVTFDPSVYAYYFSLTK
ncbi:MAG: hypothetical protein L0207_06970 [Chlamydiae bacterium]|nr:hypothetical protein [Chlamydiota bacterium]